MNDFDDDPMGALEREAHRMKLYEDTAKMMSGARSRLVLGNDPATIFFATLLMRMRMEPAPSGMKCDTMNTDGRNIFYSPEFVKEQTPEKLRGALIHEVMHIAHMHHTRRGHRDPVKWNIAADLFINHKLKEIQVPLPDGAIYPGTKTALGDFTKINGDMAVEEIYALLPDPPSGGSSQGDGDGDNPGGNGGAGEDPGGCGGVIDPGDGSPAAKQQAESETLVNVAQAEQMARRKGELPGGMGRSVGEIIRPKVSCVEQLREFVLRRIKNEYTWNKQSRRFIHQEVYLPARDGETLGQLVIAVDTSGSIDETDIQKFGGIIEDILEHYPVKLTILYHDSAVAHVQHWTPDDGPLKMEPAGGGGTSHIPVFEWIEDHQAEVEEAPAVVCLTDLWTSFPDKAPELGVLWCVVGGNESKAPFGVTIPFEFPK